MSNITVTKTKTGWTVTKIFTGIRFSKKRGISLFLSDKDMDSLKDQIKAHC